MKRQHKNRVSVAAATLAVAPFFAPAVWSQPAAPAPLPQMQFEDNEARWTAFGKDVRVGITREIENVHGGNAALQFDYTIAPGGLSAMLLPTPGGLSAMKSLKFHVKSDHTTPLVVALQEAGGARYMALFQATANAWQAVELAPADFLLFEEMGSPADANNQLDLDQVQALAIADFGQFLAQISDQKLNAMFTITPGPHALYLDDLALSPDPLPAAAAPNAALPENVVLDDFAHPQLAWIALGGVRLSRMAQKMVDENGGGERFGVQAQYTQAPATPTGLVRRLKRGALRGNDQLSLRAASKRATTLIVQLEESGGGKYYAPIEIAGGSEAKEFVLPFDEWKAADDSRDTNGQFDLESVKQIFIFDAAGFLRPDDVGENTLWIGDIRAARAG